MESLDTFLSEIIGNMDKERALFTSYMRIIPNSDRELYAINYEKKYVAYH